MNVRSIIKAGLLASTSSLALLGATEAANAAQPDGAYAGLSVGYQAFWGNGIEATSIECCFVATDVVYSPMPVKASGVAGGIFGGYGRVIPGTQIYVGGEVEFWGSSANGVTGGEGQFRFRAKYGVNAGPRVGFVFPGALAWLSGGYEGARVSLAGCTNVGGLSGTEGCISGSQWFHGVRAAAGLDIFTTNIGVPAFVRAFVAHSWFFGQRRYFGQGPASKAVIAKIFDLRAFRAGIGAGVSF